MPDYRSMYFALSARVADAVEILLAAQTSGEDRYMEDDHPGIELLPQSPVQEPDKK